MFKDDQTSLQRGVKAPTRKNTLRYFLPVSLGLVALVTLVLAAYYESNLDDDVLSEVRSRLENTTRVNKNLIEQGLKEYAKDVSFLIATPPISGMTRALQNGGVDPLDGSTYAQWTTRLDRIFTSLLQNHPEFDQARVISVDGKGMELVRVDRLTGRIEVIPEDQLQSKASADYFAPSATLGDRDLYVSSITLNKEFGKLEFPYRPTVRISAAISYPDGRRFGFLILNINASQLLGEVRNSVEKPQFAIVADSNGHIIEHPNEEFRFTAELSPDIKWQTLYTNEQNVRPFGKAIDRATGEAVYYHRTKVLTSGDRESGFLTLITVTPADTVAATLLQRRLSTYGFVAIVLGILLIILISYHLRIKSNLAVAEAKSGFAAIVSGSTDAIIGMDLHGVITSWNDSAQTMFGYAESHVIGRAIFDLGLFPRRILANSLDATSGGATLKSQELIATSREGRRLDVSVNISPIQSDIGEMLGVAALVRDISEQKAAEEKIRQSNEELEEQVAVRTSQLEVAHQEAIKSSELKSAFISTVSHEMRTPLNGMMGTINLIKREPLSPTQQKYLGMTETSTNTLATLINDILDLSKIEAGKLEFEQINFNLTELIESLANSQAVKAQEKGLEFILDTSGIKHSDVIGDPNRLRQILSNLTSNAVKFTEKGHVCVRVETRIVNKGMVSVNCEVIDSGIGVHEAAQNKLFQAFSQGNSSVSGKYGGSGLGLSICRQLCELMDGDIGFHSQVGEGSTFYFNVRLMGKADTAAAPTSTLRNHRAVVIVDDPLLLDATNRLFLSLSASVSDSHQWIDEQRHNSSPDPESVPDVIVIDRGHGAFKWLTQWLKTLYETSGTLVRTIVLRSPFDSAPTTLVTGMETVVKPLSRSALINLLIRESRENEILPDDSNVREGTREMAGTGTAVEGCVIMIVDDSEINLEVARGMLLPLGVNIILASTGSMALDLLNKSRKQGHPVECILMDCQMPVMDGYEATQRIRHGDAGGNYRGVPIIAMTASAMSGERERCLSAGMSDYITKPVDASTLCEKVVNWLSVARKHDLHGMSGKSRERQATVLPDSSVKHYPESRVLDREAVLSRLMNEHKLVDRISVMFLNAGPGKMEELEHLVNSMDRDGVRHASHSLKGSAGQIGAERLAKYLQDLENVAVDGDEADVKAIFEAGKRAYEELHAMLLQDYPDSDA